MPNTSNLFDLDYSTLSKNFKKFSFPIIDVHSHINGKNAVKLFKKALELYGIELIYSMTNPNEMSDIKKVLGNKIRFIITPSYLSSTDLKSTAKNYSNVIAHAYSEGTRIAKFWAAPRVREMGLRIGNKNLLQLNSPTLKPALTEAVNLNMLIMVHVADPDTWFKTTYQDKSLYGTKLEQYLPFEETLSLHNNTKFIAAHMAGYPENLEFLDGLLTRHSNLHLDASAAKWMIRELGKHSANDLITFFTKWQDRIMFGSDIVTSDAHLTNADSTSWMAAKANDKKQAFDLYASRYYVLRTMYETTYVGQSPIADPDLALVEPDKYTSNDSPKLLGKNFPENILKKFYFENANNLIEPYYL